MIWLLDTNVLVYVRNEVASVVSRLDEVWEQGEVVTSLLVVGELIFGVEKSIRREENLAAVEQQLAMLDAILPPTRHGAVKRISLKFLTVDPGDEILQPITPAEERQPHIDYCARHQSAWRSARAAGGTPNRDIPTR